MLKILFLNLYDDILVEKTKNLEKVMDFKTYVGNRNVSDAEMKNQIRWAEKEGMDAIVCEWDVYDSIIQYKPMVSVYPVTFSSFDTCVILYLLKKELERKNLPYRKVILGTRLPINVQTEILEEMYDFDIFIPAWKEDMEQEFFDSWAERGYEVVVCGPQFSQEVKASGMYHFYDEQVFHYVYFQQDIRRTVQKIAEEKQYRHLLEEMKIMINYSFESICILDKEGKIMICNDQAKATFGMHYPGELTGVCFSDLVSAISKEELDEILYTGKNYFSKVVNVNESTGMLNITPIFDKGIDNGAVVHFTTIQQIDKMESQVKIEFYNKGHFAKYHGAVFLMCLEMGTVCFLLSALQSRKPLGLSIGIAVLFYLLDLFGRVIPALRKLKVLNPFSYSNGADIFSEVKAPAGAWAVGAGVTILALGLAVWAYRRRDLV